jgi:hypothetical protein
MDTSEGALRFTQKYPFAGGHVALTA